jgi:mRNA interferase RelE/StbE
MTYRPRYHPDVKANDVPKLNRTMKKRIKITIEQRLLVSPENYSEPLRRTLKGYRKLRVGDYWIVLKIEGADTLILCTPCSASTRTYSAGAARQVPF